MDRFRVNCKLYSFYVCHPSLSFPIPSFEAKRTFFAPKVGYRSYPEFLGERDEVSSGAGHVLGFEDYQDSLQGAMRTAERRRFTAI
jgi:hypothetical protein